MYSTTTGKAGAMEKPHGWPANIEYLRSLLYSKRLTKETLRALNSPRCSADCETLKDAPGPCSRVRIRWIEAPNHPANGQHGLFAWQHLHPQTLILFYLGYVHDEAETDPNSNYDLSLDRDLALAVDATRHGNEARFINDYRGVADAPNAEFRDVWVATAGGRLERRVAVYVLSAGKSGRRAKGIAKGEEILVSYGKGFWNERNKSQLDDATAADL